MKNSLLIATLLVVTACNREDQPEAPTRAEAERLNEAEEMLNELANEDLPFPEPEERQP